MKAVIIVLHGTVLPRREFPSLFLTPQRPMHYMDVNVTPTHTESGEEREADDWQPRANILFNEDSISLDQQESVTKFSDKYYVKREFVANYVQHLTDLRHAKDIRARQRVRDKTEREGKSYDDYNWLDLVVNRKLINLKVVELNKYLDKNKLSKKGKKTDKLNAITVDVLRKKQTDAIETAIEETGSDNNISDINSDSDGDLILEELGDDTESESEVEEAKMITSFSSTKK
ncbi:histone chaperone rtt106-like, partial, partial [Paramuricea clavata]